MEEKYKNRESRPEDLQLISELKDLIAERDQLIKKLIVRLLCSLGVMSQQIQKLISFKVFEMYLKNQSC